MISRCDRSLLALSQLGVFGCIASFIVSSPILYTTYLGGQPGAIGIIGVIFGTWNALNGLPIAHAADSGFLNRVCSCFPLETWGRRAPWILFGTPITAVAGFVMWCPPVYGQGPVAIAVWYAIVYFVLANGFTAALQSIMAAIQELMPDAKSLAQQVALGQPVNLIAFTVAGLILPLIAFTEAPDDGTLGSSCCVQPLQRCVAEEKMSTCSCFMNSTHFVSSLVKQCSSLAGPSASFGYNVSKCNMRQEDKGPSFQFGNFTICGVILAIMTLSSWIAIIPSRKSERGKNKQILLSQSVGICAVLKASFGLHSFRWTAFANLFANVNEQLTVQLLPFYLIYCVGVDFRSVGSVNALVAGGQVGAALLSVPIFAYILTLEKEVEIETEKGQKMTVHIPKVHPAKFMAAAAMLKLVIQLPLTIAAATNHNVMLMAAAGFAGGTSTGGQPQVTQVLLVGLWMMMKCETMVQGEKVQSWPAMQLFSIFLLY